MHIERDSCFMYSWKNCQVSSLREEVEILKLHVLWYSAEEDMVTIKQQVRIGKQFHINCMV